ncbi:DUF4359 domain-containing protein [Pseudoneobacillus rhizosphaerae]|uniref:DUF4359 domain-containing protein n=1 Tax=Pseudoneobacillus rhizosphaerae TaxID=2880968 RepID=A0A9C7GAC3_9BACI|nr:DUF4359 domain-containing protein [Pseudoneobacillus rhizosphaerae]CAG9608513.1 hypothetical protein NEOCIP111885_02207 [Pseudoneobacillus rhizosphaerae]
MKRTIYFIGLVVLVFFLTETNPTRSEYVTWLNDKTLNESSNFLEKGVISLVGQTIFDASTTHSDYYLFSVYTTDFSDFGKGKVKSIGIFNQFITISKK